jgi:uncharacterized membrane protein
MAPTIEWIPFLGTVIILQGLNLLFANFHISYAVYLPGYLTVPSFFSLFIFHFIATLIISLLIFRIIINLKTKRGS